jgi:hypothetical protein
MAWNDLSDMPWLTQPADPGGSLLKGVQAGSMILQGLQRKRALEMEQQKINQEAALAPIRMRVLEQEEQMKGLTIAQKLRERDNALANQQAFAELASLNAEISQSEGWHTPQAKTQLWGLAKKYPTLVETPQFKQSLDYTDRAVVAETKLRELELKETIASDRAAFNDERLRLQGEAARSKDELERDKLKSREDLEREKIAGRMQVAQIRNQGVAASSRLSEPDRAAMRAEISDLKGRGLPSPEYLLELDKITERYESKLRGEPVEEREEYSPEQQPILDRIDALKIAVAKDKADLITKPKQRTLDFGEDNRKVRIRENEAQIAEMEKALREMNPRARGSAPASDPGYERVYDASRGGVVPVR